MENTPRDQRVAEDSATEHTDESRVQETSVVPAGQMLANPRRVRVN